MFVSYDKLWKLLIDKKMNKGELAKASKISTSTIAKMGKNELVAMTVLLKICNALNCDVGDIVSVICNNSEGGYRNQRGVDHDRD